MHFISPPPPPVSQRTLLEKGKAQKIETRKMDLGNGEEDIYRFFFSPKFSFSFLL